MGSTIGLKCTACFDDNISINNAVTCQDGHVSCTECIQRAIKIAVGSNQRINCFANCGKTYDDIALWKAIPFDDNLRRAYDAIVQREELAESGIKNLHACPFCDNKVVIEQEGSSTFRCNGCKRESCIHCKQVKHDGPCISQTDKDTENFILRCFCGLPIVRGDACNKIKCPQCRRQWCWICKKNLLGAVPYEHFDGGKCPLYGERPKDQKFAVNKMPAVVRKRLTNVGLVGLGIDEKEACPPPNQEVVQRRRRPPPPNQNVQKRRPMCQGRTIKGKICKFRAKRRGFCLHHIRQVIVVE